MVDKKKVAQIPETILKKRKQRLALKARQATQKKKLATVSELLKNNNI